MARPFRMHVGGPIGSGKQMVSWVHIDDVCGMILMAIDKPELSGPMNVTSPNPVNMEQLAEAHRHHPASPLVPSRAGGGRQSALR